MPFKPKTVPWNRGKTGLEAGWTPERRLHQSRLQTEWMRANPDNGFARSGPEVWKFGPDPEVRRHRYRFLRARAQAKFWQQPWTILWEDYLDLLKTAPGEWSRRAEALNLTRIDTDEGWHIWNVQLMKRIDAMRRPTRMKKRIRPKGLGSKKKGITWRRGTRGDT